MYFIFIIVFFIYDWYLLYFLTLVEVISDFLYSILKFVEHNYDLKKNSISGKLLISISLEFFSVFFLFLNLGNILLSPHFVWLSVFVPMS